MQIYYPKKFETPHNLIDVPSAWKGLEMVLLDILDRFQIKRNRALEFGVEYGFSTVVLSNYFDHVTGVDHFQGDEHTENGAVNINEVRAMMPANVELFPQSYLAFINGDVNQFDLIHIDIIHTYDDTYALGDWAMQHAQIVLFHDTKSFPAVKQAVEDLAKKYNLEFYNYPFHNGLGILCRNLLN